MKPEIEQWRRNMSWKSLVNAGFRIRQRTLLPKRCPGCHRWRRDVCRRRLNTAYVDETQNFQISCEDCYEETVEHYADLWSGFYSDCL